MLLPKTGARTPVENYSQIICIYSGNCIQYTKILISSKKSRSLWPRPPSCQKWQLCLSASSLALSSPAQWQLSVSLTPSFALSSPAPRRAVGSVVTEVSCVVWQPPARTIAVPVQLLRTPGLSTARSLQSKQIVCFWPQEEVWFHRFLWLHPSPDWKHAIMLGTPCSPLWS